MKLEIETADRHDAFALLGTDDVQLHQRIDLGDGVAAVYEGSRVQKSPGYPTLSTFEIALATGIAAETAAEKIFGWLSKGLPSKPATIVVDKAEIAFDQGRLARILGEKLS